MKKKLNKGVEEQKVKALSFNDIKKFMETKLYREKREELFKEINNRPVVIDRSVFKKGPKEKVKALNSKIEWKREMKKIYGRDWKKYNNTPEILAD